MPDNSRAVRHLHRSRQRSFPQLAMYIVVGADAYHGQRPGVIE